MGPVIAKVEARESKATTVLVDFDEVLDANYVLSASKFIVNGAAATGAVYTGTTNNKQVTLTVATISKGAEVKVTLLGDAVQDKVSPTANKSIDISNSDKCEHNNAHRRCGASDSGSRSKRKQSNNSTRRF